MYLGTKPTRGTPQWNSLFKETSLLTGMHIAVIAGNEITSGLIFDRNLGIRASPRDNLAS
jgi:hypothetical protein